MANPIPASLDGAQPLRYAEMGALLRERAQLAAMWFVPIQRPNGAFPYTYDPTRDRYDLREYNEVRHAGVTYALFQASGTFDDPALTACARHAARYILHSCVSVPGGGAAYLHKGLAKLGGVALALVAMLEGKHVLATDAYDDVIADLGTFLLSLELPGHPGRYAQSFDASTQEKLLTPPSNYYPGEALLALVRLHRAFPDGPWLAAAQRAAAYLIRVKDGDLVAAGTVPRDDHWLAIALSELARFDPNPDYATVAFLQAERMIRNQYQPDDPEPWRIGAGKRNPIPSNPSTATQAEALNAVCALARTLGNAAVAERYAQAALRSAQFLLRMQNTAANCTTFPHPERAIGAWAQDSNHPLIRIDYVQHGISALLGAGRLLDTMTSETIARKTPPSPLQIVESTVIGCHNQWSMQPVLRLTIRGDVHEPANSRIRTASAQVERELVRLPSAAKAVVPPADSDSIGRLVARAVLVMQQSLGDELSFAQVWPGQVPGDVELVVGCRYEAVATAAAQLAVALVRSVIDQTHGRFDFLREFDKQVAAKHPSRACRPDVRSLLAAADRRAVPIRSVDVDRGMVSLGTGAFGRRFWNLSTSNTSAHGVRFAKDKHWASRLLRAAGLPVPTSLPVNTLAQARRAALEIGYPVVLKPNLGSQGRDVFVDIRDEAELVDLYAAALGNHVTGEWLVEQYVPGNEHRVLVVGGKVVAANRRIPSSVTGDGRSSVQRLIDQLNADPSRSFESGFALKPVVVGPQLHHMLQRQGLTLDSVPHAGQAVQLNAVSNVSAGGSTMEVLDRMHSDNIQVASTAAQVIGLDFAGIDLVVPDIERSIWATGGAIVEINSHPGVIDHLQPGAGPARDVGTSILDALFPPGQPVRAVVIAVVASEDAARVCRAIAQAESSAGRVVGLATREDVVIDGMSYADRDARDLVGTRAIMESPGVEVAIIEAEPARIVEHGLGVCTIDVVVLLVLSGVARPSGEPIETVLIDALDEGGTLVLNAGIPAIRSLADRWTGSVVLVESDDAAVAAVGDRPHLDH